MADNDKVQFQNLNTKKMAKPAKNIVNAPKQVEKKKEEFKEEKLEENKEVEEKTEAKVEEKKPEKKKATPIVKKYESKVYARSLPISLRYSVAIGKFIKRKTIAQAIKDLEAVKIKKKVLPMMGEFAHKKGRGIMSGKYPVKSSDYFIQLLKTLNANSVANGMELEDTRITEVIANKAPSRMHRGGRTQFKQTHVLIVAKEVQKHIKAKETKKEAKK